VGSKATHWMISSTITFLSPPSPLLPLQVTIRFDHLEWHLMWSTCHGILVCTKLPTPRREYHHSIAPNRPPSSFSKKNPLKMTFLMLLAITQIFQVYKPN
jgi:hypothetical protein